MKSMEDRARELINPLDLGCEALRDKIVKIFIQALKDQEQITRYACSRSVKSIKPFLFLNDASGIDKNDAVQAIINVNTEKGIE